MTRKHKASVHSLAFWLSTGPLCAGLPLYVGLSPDNALAQSIAVPAAANSSPFSLPFERYTLANGLEVILHRDTRLPTVALNLWYHVGAAHEPSGRSGFAHLFEHLMFEGSKYAGQDFDPLLESVGGTNMNGTTSWDRTNYFETVPAEHLELALWLEADRMGFMIDVLTQERLDVQRDVVKNERRESYDNAPYGKSWLRLYEELFPVGHPYRGAVIGSMSDLSAATFEDVQAFFTRYYAPGNATLCLAGNFDPLMARGFIDKYFGSLPARGGRVLPQLGKASPQAPMAARRAVVQETVELPQVLWGWLAPPAYTAEQPALEVALQLLGQGKASRLYQSLVASGMANWVNVSLDANQLASMITIDVGVASGHSVQEIEVRLTEELRKAQSGVTAQELARAKVSLELNLKSELQLLNSGAGEGGRAGLLQRFNHYLDDPGALERWALAWRAVQSSEAQSALQHWLAPEQHVTIITEPAPPKGAP